MYDFIDIKASRRQRKAGTVKGMSGSHLDSTLDLTTWSNDENSNWQICILNTKLNSFNFEKIMQTLETSQDELLIRQYFCLLKPNPLPFIILFAKSICKIPLVDCLFIEFFISLDDEFLVKYSTILCASILHLKS